MLKCTYSRRFLKKLRTIEMLKIWASSHVGRTKWFSDQNLRSNKLKIQPRCCTMHEFTKMEKKITGKIIDSAPNDCNVVSSKVNTKTWEQWKCWIHRFVWTVSSCPLRGARRGRTARREAQKIVIKGAYFRKCMHLYFR